MASIFLISYLAMAAPTGGKFSVFSRDDAKSAFLELLVWIVTYAYYLEAGGNDNDTGGCVDTPPLPANRSEKRPNLAEQIESPRSLFNEQWTRTTRREEGCWARECAKLWKLFLRIIWSREEYEKFLFFFFFELKVILKINLKIIPQKNAREFFFCHFAVKNSFQVILFLLMNFNCFVLLYLIRSRRKFSNQFTCD